MKIIYYSRGSLVPALLAAAKHLEPAANLEQTLRRAACWWSGHNLDEKKVRLELLGRNDAGASIYALTAPVPPGLLERTIANLCGLFGDGRDAESFILITSLPFSRSGEGREKARLARSGRKLSAMWPDIEAAVNQARLQIALHRKLQL